jgi:inward rectifier potassium channel
MASIGYGAMYPRTFYANVVVTFEALIGLLGVAVGTGLAFARFSRPTARVLFTRVAVIAPHDGMPTLMFRAANQRRNQILEAQLRVRLVRDEITRRGNSCAGSTISNCYAVKIRSSHCLGQRCIRLTRTVPYGATAEMLTESETTLVISLVGIDETVAQTIYARHLCGTGDPVE